MPNPMDYFEAHRYDGTGSFTAVLNTNGIKTNALTEGTWAVWATEDYAYQLLASSTNTIGANPRRWPARFVDFIHVKQAGAKLGIKRVSVSGNYYCNKISGPA